MFPIKLVELCVVNKLLTLFDGKIRGFRLVCSWKATTENGQLRGIQSGYVSTCMTGVGED